MLAIYSSAAFTNTSGVAVAASASVEVRREDTGALASIFSDVDGLNALANPFNADANGRFSLYAAGLSLGYKITVTKDAVSHVLRHQAIGTAAQIDLPTPAGVSDGFTLTVNEGIAYWLSRPFSGAFIINGKITRTVNAGALTIALKTLAGADPSPTDPVFVLMPTLTSGAFDGGYAIRKVTASLPFVISSGSTLGHASAVAGPVYIYLGDNASILVLGASNKFFGGAFVASSTAEGGAGGADSGTTLYSTAAQTNIAWVCLQRWQSTQTTAGTWASTAGEVELYPFSEGEYRSVQIFTAGGTWTKPAGLKRVKVTVVGAGGGSGGSAATGASDYTSSIGGGGGGMSVKTIAAASLGATEAVTVGTGGTAGAAGNNNGGAGSTSSFGVHCSATGGVAGTGDAANSGGIRASGVVGGIGSGGDYNAAGGSSGPVSYARASTVLTTSVGGSSPLGAGGLASPNSAGEAGRAYGGGAAGSSSIESQAAKAGAVGAAGIVIVEEFF